MPTITHTALLGPFDKPNAVVTVQILGRAESRRMFRAKVTAIDPKSCASPLLGALINVHENKITPAVDWEGWGMSNAPTTP